VGPWLVEVKTPGELDPWLGGGPPERPHSTVMMVRGDGPAVRVFLPNALDAAKVDAGRVVVWLRDPKVLDAERSSEIFGDSGWCLAVVLGADGKAASWVTSDRVGVEDAAFAFVEAEKAKKVETFNV
jgi:hypothetical protein